MDDLTRIDGIGKATARRLSLQGFETFAQLAGIEDGEDGRAEQLGVKSAWIAEAAKIVAEIPAGSPAGEDRQPAPAEASAAASAGAPSGEGPGGVDTDKKVASEAGAVASAPEPSFIDTAPESLGVGDAPIAGVPDAPLGDVSEAVAAVTTLRGPHGIADQPAAAGELIARTIATVVSGERRRFPVNWTLMHDGRLTEEGGSVELTLVEHQKLAGGVVSMPWLSGETVE